MKNLWKWWWVSPAIGTASVISGAATESWWCFACWIIAVLWMRSLDDKHGYDMREIHWLRMEHHSRAIMYLFNAIQRMYSHNYSEGEEWKKGFPEDE